MVEKLGLESQSWGCSRSAQALAGKFQFLQRVRYSVYQVHVQLVAYVDFLKCTEQAIFDAGGWEHL